MFQQIIQAGRLLLMQRENNQQYNEMVQYINYTYYQIGLSFKNNV